MRTFFVLLFAVYFLSACGHKGPLYLPKVDEGNRASPAETEKK